MHRPIGFHLTVVVLCTSLFVGTTVFCRIAPSNGPGCCTAGTAENFLFRAKPGVEITTRPRYRVP